MIRSLLTFTGTDTDNLFARYASNFPSKDVCINYFEERKTLAETDIATLTQHGTTHDVVLSKLKDIVAKAKVLLQTSPPKNAESGVTVDGKWTVTIQPHSQRGTTDKCFLCDYKNEAPQEITIKNIKSSQELKIRDLSIHVLGHTYYGQQDPFRIDPAKVCKVLELSK